MMHAAISLLCARLQQVEEFFVVAEQFFEREHEVCGLIQIASAAKRKISSESDMMAW